MKSGYDSSLNFTAYLLNIVQAFYKFYCSSFIPLKRHSSNHHRLYSIPTRDVDIYLGEIMF